MYFSIACPHCQKTLKVRDELIGSTARCPHCRGTITVQRPSASETEAVPQVASSATEPGVVATADQPPS